MSEQTNTPDGDPSQSGITATYRPFTIRISDNNRAELDILARLYGRKATEEARLALEHWVTKMKGDPQTLERAQAARSEFEEENETRRRAMEAVLGTQSEPTTADSPKTRSTSGRKTATS